MTDEKIVLRLAHSPDSDDLVMWWPIVGGEGGGEPVVDTGRFRFEPVARDVERLNKEAAGEGVNRGGGGYDITAISAATYPRVADRYVVTRCGGSFGEGYGPKVVVRKDASIKCAICLGSTDPVIAVPGVNTTAFMVLNMVLGREPRFVEMPFEQIMDAVVGGERAGAGLLIHEAQLMFASAGLREVVDLGQWWQGEHDLPLPLGLNVIRRDLDDRFGPGSCEEVAAILGQSVAYAREHADESRRFLAQQAGARPEWRDEELVDRYLSMYVSDLSADMGERGVRALQRLYEAGAEAELCEAVEVCPI